MIKFNLKCSAFKYYFGSNEEKNKYSPIRNSCVDDMKIYYFDDGSKITYYYNKEKTIVTIIAIQDDRYNEMNLLYRGP